MGPQGLSTRSLLVLLLFVQVGSFIVPTAKSIGGALRSTTCTDGIDPTNIAFNTTWEGSEISGIITALCSQHSGVFDSSTAAKKWVRKGLVYQNEKRAAVDTKISPGDAIVVLYSNRGSLPGTKASNSSNFLTMPKSPILFNGKPLYLDVLYEDDFIAVVLKPAGLPTFSTTNGRRTLVNTLASSLQPSTQADALSDGPHHCHRLDMPTSGLVVCGKTSTSIYTVYMYHIYTEYMYCIHIPYIHRIHILYTYTVYIYHIYSYEQHADSF